MTAEQFIKAQLAALAHREGAHHGGIDNMLAVAFVMRNRRLAGWQGGDWMNIISCHEQSAGTIYEKSAPDIRDLTFRTFLQQVDDIFSGFTPDKMTEGALFYAELNNVTPWFRANVLSNLEMHPRVAQVGPVTLFR
jgi:hypothetical protein